jgi:CRP-like cAMP-binding protein
MVSLAEHPASAPSDSVTETIPPSTVPCVACPLRALPVFRTNTPEETAFIESMRLGQVDAPAGATIIEEGSQNPPLYSLFSGWAFRYKTLRDGRHQILNFLLPGDVIGFQAHMLGDSAHGVEALTDVRLCRHARPKVWELYRNYPELAFDTTWLTAKEENLVDEILTSVGRRSASERIAMLMINLYKRARSLDPHGPDPVHVPLTQLHVADALGLSLVHTNKTLRRLQRRGLFVFEQQRLTLLDPAGLERLADYFEGPLATRPLL